MACLPIIFAPLRSFKFLFGIGCGRVCLSEDVPKNAELFCLERNIDLSLYTKERK